MCLGWERNVKCKTLKVIKTLKKTFRNILAKFFSFWRKQILFKVFYKIFQSWWLSWYFSVTHFPLSQVADPTMTFDFPVHTPLLQFWLSDWLENCEKDFEFGSGSGIIQSSMGNIIGITGIIGIGCITGLFHLCEIIRITGTFFIEGTICIVGITGIWNSQEYATVKNIKIVSKWKWTSIFCIRIFWYFQFFFQYLENKEIQGVILQ